MSNDTSPPPRPMPRNLRLPAATNIRSITGTPARPGAEPKPKRPAKCPRPPANLSPAAAEIWRRLSKSLWARETWAPEFVDSFSGLCVLQARFQSDPNMPASLVSQLRLLQIEFGLTPRSRRARMIERDGT